ncbi:MAG: hypothetical protein A2498_11520 [Lentisphaerae bacterium RIFOXYC12_FULL_60_16]|nr:MAG: hypothetical protein A2498_11520 [Lentisphaerae bacterium RIFOXYC12_FULL_60_16]
MNSIHLITAAVLTIGLAGCGGQKSEQEKARQTTAEAMQVSANAMEQQAKQMAQAMQEQNAVAGTAVELADFREMKKLLPEKASGLPRTEHQGSKNEAFGVRVSNAEARYENDDGSSIHIQITDMGGMAGTAMLAQMAWANMKIDNESDSGYERTVTVAGNKGFERFDSDSQHGELQIMVANRFMVAIDSQNVAMKAVLKMAEELPLSKLAGLAK